ncbi:outer membrane beta-barrel protein [Tunicatimonas pelagia]|uniref:outer membrane beta-barrel protein n=1 Tax=Tunicatimonas pelagia TaxID=931531 RepID=UPI002665FDB1|nr:outer membrane beta-barrel protein [Tunicatimonas pelagia]WKN46197.1 outer membrane beta-barrel protein [Tunicatimonas pelagia]
MKKILFTILALVTLHSVSQAQFSLGVTGGPALSTGNSSNFIDNGFGLGIDARYQISPNVMAGLGFQRFSYDANALGINIPGVDFTINPITASVAFTPMTEGITPYVGIKGGIYDTRVGIGSLINVSRTYFGFAPTAGVLVPISKFIDIHANVEYHTLFVNESIPLTEISLSENINFVPINIGISFKLGQ